MRLQLNKPAEHTAVVAWPLATPLKDWTIEGMQRVSGLHRHVVRMVEGRDTSYVVKELPDHLAVVLEFAALGDRLTGDALLVEHRGAIGLLRDSLAKMDSAYAHVLDAVLATLPEPTPEIKARMAQVAASGPPVEQIGLEPFPSSPTVIEIGARR